VDVEQIFSGIFAGAFKIIFSRKHGFIELFRQFHVLFPTIFLQYQDPDFFTPGPRGEYLMEGLQYLRRCLSLTYLD